MTPPVASVLDRSGRRLSPRKGVSRCFLAGAFGFLLGGFFSGAAAQEEMTLNELDLIYQRTVVEHTAALLAMESVESEFTRALLRLSTATEAGEEAEANLAYAEIQDIADRRRYTQRQLEERADSLREARGRLIDSSALHLGELLARGDTTTDPVTRGEIGSQIENTRLQLATLRGAEEPQVTLEPLPDYTKESRDGPTELRAKAGLLEFAANQYEEQHAYFERQLEALRRDQSLLRRSRDFFADRVRFDDRPPGGTPGTRTDVPPEETFEERIQLLVNLQETLTGWIQDIRVRAADLRRQAGGQWA